MAKLSHEEKAYRRGVHQAYAMLEQYLETTAGADPDDTLRLFLDEAKKLRATNIEVPFLLHRIQENVDKRLHIQRERVV